MPFAQLTRAFHAQKDVRPSGPRSVLEPGLNDHVDAFAHRSSSLFECPRALPFDVHDCFARSGKALDVCPFVVETSLPEDFDHGIIEEWPLRETVSPRVGQGRLGGGTR